MRINWGVVLGGWVCAAACQLDDRSLPVPASTAEDPLQMNVSGADVSGDSEAATVVGTDPAEEQAGGLPLAVSNVDGVSDESTGEPADEGESSAAEPTGAAPADAGCTDCAPPAPPSEPACAAGLEACTSGCFDLLTSAAHCGACDAACAPELECRDGGCVCQGALDACGGRCVDTQTDAAHCGNCGVACGPNEACRAGGCACSGELFPCVVRDHVAAGTRGYGVLNLAGYSDATRAWAAYVDSTGNLGSTIVIHDTLTLANLRRIEVPEWEVQLAFLPTEPTLLYSNGGSLFRLREGGAPERLPIEGVTWFELSLDGSLLAVWDRAQLGIYSYPALNERAKLDVSITVADQNRRIGISRDARRVALSGAYDNNQIQVFDLVNGTTRIMTATGATATYSPTFSRNGNELYVGGGYADGRVYVFDSNTGAQLRRLQVSDNYVYSIDLVPGFDQLLVGGYDGALRIVSATDGTVLVNENVGFINRAVFSPDGNYIYSGHGAGGDSRLAVHRVE